MLTPSIRVLTLSLVAACAAAQTPLPAWDEIKRSSAPEDIKLVRRVESMFWLDACVAFGVEERKPKLSKLGSALRGYLVEKQLLRDSEIGLVSRRDVEIGASECAAVASLGRPDTVHQTETARHLSRQYVYRSKRIYIHAEEIEGRVGLVVWAIHM